MTENNNQTFLTSFPDEKPIQSIVVINDDEDDLEIDIKSSADSGETPHVNNEIDEILNKKPLQEYSSVRVPTIPNDVLQDKM
jgi:hypothetical protein